MSHTEQHEQNLRDLKLIRDDHGWALSRVIRARELEREVDRYREALERLAAFPDQPGHQKAREQREMVAIAKAAVGGDPE